MQYINIANCNSSHSTETLKKTLGGRHPTQINANVSPNAGAVRSRCTPDNGLALIKCCWSIAAPDSSPANHARVVSV